MHRRLRVLITASTFPLRPDDGRPRFILDLAQALAPHCDVTVLAPDAPGLRLRETIGGVRVDRFTYFHPRQRQCLASGLSMVESMRGSALAKVQVPLFVAAQVKAIGGLLESERFDVVNSHWLVPQGLAGAVQRDLGRTFAHVLSIHAGDVYLLRKLPGGRKLAAYVAGRSDAILSDGSHVRDTLDELLGRSSGAVLQPMGANLELFRARGGTNADPAPVAGDYLLFFGRLVEKKGTIYLIRAMPRVLERFPRMGLVLVGGGPLEGELRAETERLGLGHAIRFVGPQPHAEIARYLRHCHAAVVPSVIDRHGETDGMPTVVIEAMAAGTKVVGAAVDGIPDVIRHRQNGWLCRPNDPADLADKILAALENDGPASTAEALATAEQFSWPRVAERYMEVFDRVTRR